MALATNHQKELETFSSGQQPTINDQRNAVNYHLSSVIFQ
jgi:hypothetical protein